MNNPVLSYGSDAAAMIDALGRTPNWQKVQQVHEGLDNETVGFIINEAASFAAEAIAPLNVIADRQGAQFVDGQVTVPSDYHAAFDALAEGGWLGLEQPEAYGGQGLPLSMFVAVNPLFERACPAFMMSAGGTRAAALLLNAWAEQGIRDDWVPALVNGERCATICISEPEAGSDVGRIRTRGQQDADGNWRVSGQKIWISFGDHDIRSRIGHCMLARTSDDPGTRGLSLFLVENGPQVVTERIEEKMGLHGSPTCALRFNDAPALLIGEPQRGLPQLFTMIRHMRLTVACQGLGGAMECLRVAEEHVRNRRQGGHPGQAPVTIDQHPDVQRQLLEIRSRIDLFRLALLEAATAADLSADDASSARLCGWLLPLVKNFGAELAFDSAARSIQILGGAGYTTDYSVEQVLRDSRVFAIYEGTTGMQGLDFLIRQSLPDHAAALNIFLEVARQECAEHTAQLAVIEQFSGIADLVVKVAEEKGRESLIPLANSFLNAGWIAVQAWLSARIPDSDGTRHFLVTANARLSVHEAEVRSAILGLGQ